MTSVFLGFTFLIAALFPVGTYLAQLATGGFGGPTVTSLPPIISYLVLLALTYAPAAVVTAIAFYSTNLKRRLPKSPSGQRVTLTGVILTIFYLAIPLLVSTIQGRAPGLILMRFSPFILWPARVLLAIGVVQVLLAAKPSKPSMQPTVGPGGSSETLDFT
jgi:hypothetical protein